MVLNDNNVVNALKEANLLKEKNYYFSSVIMTTLKEQILYGQLSRLIQDFSGYIINYTSEGVGVLPLSIASNKPLTKFACFIEKSNIQKVEISKGGLFFYKKITIVTCDNEVISFKVVKNVLPLKKHKENLQRFVDDYQI